MTSDDGYGTPLSGYSAGMRVELHPGTGLWMAGARFGEVTSVGREYVRVQLDKLPAGSVRSFKPGRLRPISVPLRPVQ